MCAQHFVFIAKFIKQKFSGKTRMRRGEVKGKVKSIFHISHERSFFTRCMAMLTEHEIRPETLLICFCFNFEIQAFVMSAPTTECIKLYGGGSFRNDSLNLARGINMFTMIT